MEIISSIQAENIETYINEIKDQKSNYDFLKNRPFNGKTT